MTAPRTRESRWAGAAAVTLPPELAAEIERATPPPILPRGYFAPLVTPTRQLLERGFKLPQAADWFIERGIFPPEHRQRFHAALRQRLHRLRYKAAKEASAVSWMESLFYESSHAVIHGGQALCGASASGWTPETRPGNRCSRCKGIVTRQGVTMG